LRFLSPATALLKPVETPFHYILELCFKPSQNAITFPDQPEFALACSVVEEQT
jgi:hypothetical protein